MKRAAVSEQAVAEVVVAYLEALGADVYQEVECAGGVADIVARVRSELWIVEVKTAPSLAVLYQALDRRRSAHRVYIATPHVGRSRISELCDELGVGMLEVRTGDPGSKWETERPRVREVVASRRWNSRPVALAAQLKPEHKTHAKAGAIGGGGRWTPFRDTCEQLARVVRDEPGIMLKAAIDKIKHHYSSGSSARGSLAQWIKAGKVDGVELKPSPAGQPLLYPVTREVT